MAGGVGGADASCGSPLVSIRPTDHRERASLVCFKVLAARTELIFEVAQMLLKSNLFIYFFFTEA